MVNRDWKIKLKIIKTSTNWPRTQTRNKKNKDWSQNSNNKESQVVIFQGEERKKKGKKTHQWQTRPPMPTHAARHGRGHDYALNDMAREYFWMPGGAAHATQNARAPPTHLLVS